MIIKKKSSLDLSNEIKGGDNSICKNVILAFLQKIGLISIRFNIESEMQVEIYADEIELLFKREDDNLKCLERDMETVVKVLDNSIKSSIDMISDRAKQSLKKFNDLREFYELLEEERERKLKRKSFEMSEDDEESDESPVKD